MVLYIFNLLYLITVITVIITTKKTENDIIYHSLSFNLHFELNYQFCYSIFFDFRV